MKEGNKPWFVKADRLGFILPDGTFIDPKIGEPYASRLAEILDDYGDRGKGLLWMTIESAPKDGTHILARWGWKGDFAYGVVWWENGKWHEHESDIDVKEPGAWTPIL